MENMTVNFDVALLGLDNLPVLDQVGTEIKLKNILANLLTGGSTNNYMQNFVLAQKVFNGEFALTIADKELIKTTIEGNKQISDLAKYRIIEILN